jgi:hypothetical protein
MELYGAEFLPTPDTRITGWVHIDWVEDGTAVAMRQGDSQRPPAAIWIIGRDDSEDDYAMLYADSRGVSRIYRMSFGGGRWRVWRDTPDFSQRFEADVASDGRKISGRWEKSADRGANWQHDFNVDYIRDAASSSRP